MTPYLKAFVASAALTSAGIGAAAELQVKVGGVPSANGKVMVSLYRSAPEFLKSPALVASAPASEGVTVIVFKDVAPGEYAVSAYHDENGNGSIDRGAMGIPTEAYGFGNDAGGAMGPPRFEQARVTLPAGGAATALTLKAESGGAR